MSAGAVRREGQSALTFYYVHPDRLGSISVVTDRDGAVKQKCTYDAWGRRTLVQGSLIFDRGFTGHEHLDDFGLINMNARMYDPALGRFLSVDPYVQMPDYTQSFNRYSYALNNPLVYTDPSGELIGELLYIGLMVYLSGVQSNFMYAAENGGNPFNPGDWNWKSPWTYISMASAGFSAFAQTLEHCEYFVDIVNKSNKPFLYSHNGDGIFNIKHYGTWIDNHSAFKVFYTEWKDVALGGVDNIRKVADGIHKGNSFLNWLRNVNAFFENGGSGGIQGGYHFYAPGYGIFTTRYIDVGAKMIDIGVLFDIKLPSYLPKSSINAAEGFNAIREALLENKTLVNRIGTDGKLITNSQSYYAFEYGHDSLTYYKILYPTRDTVLEMQTYQRGVMYHNTNRYPKSK